MQNFTTKELGALTELMVFEQAAYKKCRMYEESLTDKASKDLVSGLAQCHRTRYLSLYNQIK